MVHVVVGSTLENNLNHFDSDHPIPAQRNFCVSGRKMVNISNYVDPTGNMTHKLYLNMYVNNFSEFMNSNVVHVYLYLLQCYGVRCCAGPSATQIFCDNSFSGEK